jgi:hypothetical protein
MGGYQFLHIASFSRKPDAEGRSADFVLAEAARRPDACLHVAAPSPPEIVFGLPLDSVRSLHDARVAEARTTNKDGKSRKLRVDHHSLMTAVLSHPATVAEVRESLDAAKDVQLWEEQSVAWLRATWGDALVSVIRHTDEAHCHLHAFIVPNGPEMRARLLHPGIAAKDREKEAALVDGADGKTANARGDNAYKAALRAMQDDYWAAVGLPCGLARLGPARRRLTRAEWRTEKAAAEAAAQSLKVAEQAKADAEAARLDARLVQDTAETERQAAASMKARADASAARAREAVAQAREQAADAKRKADEALATQAKAEQEARALAARGRRLLEQARAEAQQILASARADAARLHKATRGAGAWIAALLHGFRRASPAAVARRVAAQVRAEEEALAADRLAIARQGADLSRQQLQKAEARNTALEQTCASLGAQRDRLARELNRLQPAPRHVQASPAPAPR